MLNKYLPYFYPSPDTSISKESGSDIALCTNSSKSAQCKIKRWLFLVWKVITSEITQPVTISENGLLSTQIPSGQNKIVLQLSSLYFIKSSFSVDKLNCSYRLDSSCHKTL